MLLGQVKHPLREPLEEQRVTSDLYHMSMKVSGAFFYHRRDSYHPPAMEANDNWPFPMELSPGNQNIRTNPMVLNLFVVHLDEIKIVQLASHCACLYCSFCNYRFLGSLSTE